MRLSSVFFIERVDQSHLTMESFTIELVSNASAQLFPDNTLSFFTNFLPGQLNLNGQWEVAISEISYPTMYQNVTGGNLCFLTRNFQSHPNSITWNLVFTLPLRILLKPSTFSFKKDTITAKTVSKLKCLEERKRLRFTVQMKHPVLHSLVRIWDTYSELMLVMNLE